MFGRVLTLREMRAMLTEEAVERAYLDEKRAERTDDGAAGWAAKHPPAAALLARAMKAHHAIQD